MTKEFDELMKAQEAIRLWYQAHPKQEPPDWMVEALRRAQEAHDTPPDQAMRAANAPTLPGLD